MKNSTRLKFLVASMLVIIAVVGLIVPVGAEITTGGVHNLSSLGAGSPDIAISSDGQYIAVAYYKQTNGDGAVYVKSSSVSGGWVTSRLVGIGSDPKIVFKSGPPPYVVYVVWKKSLGTAIQSARCTLSATATPNCTLGTDVQTASVAQLNFPDVAVDGSGFIHVAWQNSVNSATTVIQTARSNAADNLSGWSLATAAPSGHNLKPALASAGSFVHLVYLSGSSTTVPTRVQYVRSGIGSHSWGNLRSFDIGSSDIIGSGVYDKLDNPSIAATGSNVYLAWDARRGAGSSDYSLIKATSSDSGGTWPSSGVTHIPDGTLATINQTSQIKSSSNSPLPPQEVGLRPSLVISNSNPAVVWQEVPGQSGCAAITPFFYIFRASPLTGAGSDYLTNQDDDDSMLDPDLAVGSSGQHYVFMRDDNVIDCPPSGGAEGYLITYRGPFTITTNDQGEGGGLYMPIIKR